MNNIKNWFMMCCTVLFAFCTISCSDDEENYSDDYLLSIAEEDLNIAASASSASYEIDLTARAIWNAAVVYANEEGAEWITLTTGSDTGGMNTLEFEVAANTTGTSRTATLIVTCHTAQKTITVTQSY